MRVKGTDSVALSTDAPDFPASVPAIVAALNEVSGYARNSCAYAQDDLRKRGCAHQSGDGRTQINLNAEPRTGKKRSSYATFRGS